MYLNIRNFSFMLLIALMVAIPNFAVSAPAPTGKKFSDLLDISVSGKKVKELIEKRVGNLGDSTRKQLMKTLAQNDEPKVENRLLVKLKNSVTPPSGRPNGNANNNAFNAAQLLNNPGVVANAKKLYKTRSNPNPRALTNQKVAAAVSEFDKWYVIDVRPGTDLQAIVSELAENDNVEWVEPDYLYKIDQAPNDPDYSLLWGMNNTGPESSGGNGGSNGVAGADINAEAAWDILTDANDVVVAVVDTGVDYDHPDLAANMWENIEELNGIEGFDDDNNGVVDDIHGADFIELSNNVDGSGDPMDARGHGTHVAGTIGAQGNNNIGVAGIAWNTNIMAVRVLGADGSSIGSSVSRGVRYAAENGADIINASLGGGAFSLAMLEALHYAHSVGTLFVAAAGNGNQNTDHPSTYYPQGYNVPNIMSIAAIDPDNTRSWFSNFGRESVDIAAPGSSVYSTMPTGPCTTCTGLVVPYAYGQGTSMATPHVAGAAALVLQHYAQIRNLPLDRASDKAKYLKQIIMSTAVPVADPEIADHSVTGGRLDLHNTLTQVSAVFSVDTNGNVIDKSVTNSTMLTINALWLNGDTSTLEFTAESSHPGLLVTLPSATATPDGGGMDSLPLQININSDVPSGRYFVDVTATGGINPVHERIVLDISDVDLVVESVDFPTIGIPDGPEVTFSTVIRNTGQSFVNDFTVHFIFDVPIAFPLPAVNVAGLSPGESQQVNLTVKIPHWVRPPGTYTGRVVVDILNNITETDEMNNSMEATMEVQIGGDLEIMSIDARPSYVCGAEPLDFDLHVANHGNGAVLSPRIFELENKYKIDVYLSLSNTLPPNSDDAVLTNFYGGHVLKAGQEATIGISTNTNFTCDNFQVLDQDYFLIVDLNEDELAFESNYNNNTMVVGPITIDRGTPDVTLENIGTHQTSVEPGQVITSYGVLRNLGNGAIESHSVQFYLSNQSGDTPLCSSLISPNSSQIAPADGGVHNIACSALVPGSLQTGVYTIKAYADPDNVMTTDPISNNTAFGNEVGIGVPAPISRSSGVDFILSGVHADAQINIGEELSIEVDAQNIGDTTWYNGPYVSAYLVQGASEYELESNSTSQLNTTFYAGMVYKKLIKYEVPIDVPPGDYQLKMVIDPYNRISEPNSNNTLFGSTVTVNSNSDLIVTSFDPPGIIYTGNNVTVTALVMNQGTTVANNNQIGVHVYISSDENVTTQDILLGQTFINTNLEPNLIVPVDINLNVSQYQLQDDYSIGVIIDGAGKVDESDETNNTLVASSTLQTVREFDVEHRDQQFDETTIVPGTQFTLPASVVYNNGRSKTPTQTALDYYLSLDTDLGDTNDIYLGTKTVGVLLGRNLTTLHPLSFTLAEGAVVGDQYFLITEIDPDNRIVDEFNEGNNIYVSPQQLNVAGTGQPIADPGGPYAGLEGQQVSFNGSNSFDPEGDSLTYSWDFGDGNSGIGVSPTHTYETAGIYTVSLTVNDGSFTSSPAETTANISTVIVSPTLSFSVNPSTIAQGESAMLFWSSTNTDNCIASNGWSGPKTTSGQQIVTPTTTTSYRLTCSGSGGDIIREVTVTFVAAPVPPPTVVINANPLTIDAGLSSTLTWSSTDASSCSASGAWSGSKATSSSQVVSPTTTSTYTLTCTGAGGSAFDSVTVTVNPLVPLPTVSISASPGTITSGGSSTLTWSSTNADSCSASGSWSGSKAPSGTQIVSPATTANYTITCINSSGQDSASTTVTVEPVTGDGQLIVQSQLGPNEPLVRGTYVNVIWTGAEPPPNYSLALRRASQPDRYVLTRSTRILSYDAALNHWVGIFYMSTKMWINEPYFITFSGSDPDFGTPRSDDFIVVAP